MVSFLIKKRSTIHRKGIFTHKEIKKGVHFYEVPLKVLSNKPISKWAYIGENKWVSDEDVLNYVNHSCDANSRLDISEIPILIAKKDIKINEEITVNYNKTEKKGKRVRCDCKSNKCRTYFLRVE